MWVCGHERQWIRWFTARMGYTRRAFPPIHEASRSCGVSWLLMRMTTCPALPDSRIHSNQTVAYRPACEHTHVSVHILRRGSQAKKMQSIVSRPSGGSRGALFSSAPASVAAPQVDVKAPAIRPVIARPSGGTRMMISQSPPSASSPRLSTRPKASISVPTASESKPPSAMNDSQKTVLITGMWLYWLNGSSSRLVSNKN